VRWRVEQSVPLLILLSNWQQGSNAFNVAVAITFQKVARGLVRGIENKIPPTSNRSTSPAYATTAHAINSLKI
jgi:hypothetical protein